MRLNKYLASTTGLSRRAIDHKIINKQIKVNGIIAVLGQTIDPLQDQVFISGQIINKQSKIQTIMLNKPIGYIVSRNGQGQKTIYDLLPTNFHHLKPIGRLDKNTSGLLLLTNNGHLAHNLSHPSFHKQKVYQITLSHPLSPKDQHSISELGILLSDGLSKLTLKPINNDRLTWLIVMEEGRNRQIRRTFQQLDYSVLKLHRLNFGSYALDNLLEGKYKIVD